MQYVSTQIELEDILSGIRRKGIKIGFVPTMGALHQGHMDLIRRCVEENDYTIVSVYVNHLQFNNKSDYENYPISREKDLALLEENGCDIAFLPDTSVMYPPGYTKIHLDLGILEKVFEGPMRPGHFDGVVQVVNRLFNYIKPDKAYFGLKDYQQCVVIKTLKTAFFPGIQLQFCNTVRLENGLAMSSRNARLSNEGRTKAAVIYKVLNAVKNLSKHIEVADALKYGRHLFKEANIDCEYLDIANADTLAPSKKWFRKDKTVLLTAVYVENVRLIDNIVF